MENATPFNFDVEFPKRRPSSTKSKSPPPKLELHPLFLVADTLISHIPDYPTLICLSMTCHTFHRQIHSSLTILPTAFLNLEREIRTTGSNTDDSDGDTYIHGATCTPFINGRESYNHNASIARRIQFDEENGTIIGDYDIFRYNTGQLQTLDWLPCYTCRKLKRAMTHFFLDQTQHHWGMLGCDALTRRCIDCSISDAFRFDEYPLRYLQDMPRGYQGYRLRCSGCRVVEWTIKRPRRRQELMKLCAGCFDEFLVRTDPTKVFWDEWMVFAGMEPVSVLGKSKISWGEPVIVGDGEDVDDEYVIDFCGAELRSESWCRFEVLEVDAG